MVLVKEAKYWVFKKEIVLGKRITRKTILFVLANARWFNFLTGTYSKEFWHYFIWIGHFTELTLQRRLIIYPKNWPWFLIINLGGNRGTWVYYPTKIGFGTFNFWAGGLWFNYSRRKLGLFPREGSFKLWREGKEAGYKLALAFLGVPLLLNQNWLTVFNSNKVIWIGGPIVVPRFPHQKRITIIGSLVHLGLEGTKIPLVNTKRSPNSGITNWNL